MMNAFILELSALPEYVFANTPIELNVAARKGKAIHRCSVKLQAHAFEQHSNRPLLVEVENTSLCLQDGFCSLVLRFKEPAVLESDLHASRCVVCVSTVDDADDRAISAISSPCVVVCHRIVMQEEHFAKYVFYKDAGGKDKGLDFQVRLVDADGNPSRDKSLTITPMLLYENGNVVKDQTILQTSADMGTALVSGDAWRDLRFRISQVSSKHQNQAFCIKISPNLYASPSAADVMPAIGMSVEVRSKIKRPAAEARSEYFGSKRSKTAGLREGGSMAAASSSLDASNELAESIDILQEWCQKTVQALEQKIKWRPIGYEMHGTDKVMMHELSNPNDLINQLVKQYREHVSKSMLHIKSMQTSLQHANANQPAAPQSMDDAHGLGMDASDEESSVEGCIPSEAIQALGGMRGAGQQGTL